jgi:hypothetical protein
MSRVLKIVESRSTIEEFGERAAGLGPSDVLGWTALARWAEDRELFTQARFAWQRVLAQDPRNPAANAGLGRVELDGAWLSRDEAYRAQGYVWFEGQWLTPPEQEAALRERAAHETAVRESRESDARVREAEARAREAEARAREAEAAADQAYGDGIPLDYVWGAGPLLYPPYAGLQPGRTWHPKRGHRHGDLRPVPVPTPVPRPATPPPMPGPAPRRQQAGLAVPSRR